MYENVKSGYRVFDHDIGTLEGLQIFCLANYLISRITWLYRSCASLYTFLVTVVMKTPAQCFDDSCVPNKVCI